MVPLPHEHTRPIQDAWRGKRLKVPTCTALLAEANGMLVRPKLKRNLDNRVTGSVLADFALLTTQISIERLYPAFEDSDDAYCYRWRAASYGRGHRC